MPFVFLKRKETGHSGKFPLLVRDEGGRLRKKGDFQPSSFACLRCRIATAGGGGWPDGRQ